MTWRDRTKKHEGLRLQIYKCSEGYWTIGYGRNVQTRGITKNEAEYLFNNDCNAVQDDVAKNMAWVLGLSEARQGVVFEMAFQIGISGVLAFKKAWEAARKGDFTTAAWEMRNSKWYKQTPARCEELAHIMEAGVE